MEFDRNAPAWAEREIEIAAPIETVWESMDGLPVRLLRAPMRRKLEVFLEAWLRDPKVEAERRAS